MFQEEDGIKVRKIAAKKTNKRMQNLTQAKVQNFRFIYKLNCALVPVHGYTT